MIRSILQKGGKIHVCSSCMKARGLTEVQLIERIEITKFAELSDFIINADKIITL
jgi:sulfur relay (sulfurtransferase) complex TusBCD TusD component (DsrE family)